MEAAEPSGSYGTKKTVTVESGFIIIIFTGTVAFLRVFRPTETPLLLVLFGRAAGGVGGGGRRWRSTRNNTQSWSVGLWKEKDG